MRTPAISAPWWISSVRTVWQWALLAAERIRLSQNEKWCKTWMSMASLIRATSIGTTSKRASGGASARPLASPAFGLTFPSRPPYSRFGTTLPSAASHFRPPTRCTRVRVNLPTSDFRPPTRCTRVRVNLPTSHFPLPTSHFRLPTSAFPLPTSHFPLPTSHFPLPTSHFPNSPYLYPAPSRYCHAEDRHAHPHHPGKAAALCG